MFSKNCELEGRKGLRWLEETGDFAVIANKELHAEGKANKFAVVNAEDQWVDSVYASPDKATNHAEKLA